jgi:hypothetical protein
MLLAYSNRNASVALEAYENCPSHLMGDEGRGLGVGEGGGAPGVGVGEAQAITFSGTLLKGSHGDALGLAVGLGVGVLFPDSV